VGSSSPPAGGPCLPNASTRGALHPEGEEEEGWGAELADEEAEGGGGGALVPPAVGEANEREGEGEGEEGPLLLGRPRGAAMRNEVVEEGEEGEEEEGRAEGKQGRACRCRGKPCGRRPCGRRPCGRPAAVPPALPKCSPFPLCIMSFSGGPQAKIHPSSKSVCGSVPTSRVKSRAAMPRNKFTIVHCLNQLNLQLESSCISSALGLT
jgi:hypothetical protein